MRKRRVIVTSSGTRAGHNRKKTAVAQNLGNAERSKSTQRKWFTSGQTTQQLLCKTVRTRLCDIMWAIADVTVDMNSVHLEKTLKENHEIKIAPK
jgi:hypothetical protein